VDNKASPPHKIGPGMRPCLPPQPMIVYLVHDVTRRYPALGANRTLGTPYSRSYLAALRRGDWRRVRRRRIPGLLCSPWCRTHPVQCDGRSCDPLCGCERSRFVCRLRACTFPWEEFFENLSSWSLGASRMRAYTFFIL
jgi:hypothetical protein